MPIINLQKRARELGRIRIGQVVPTSNGKTRPEKLDRFRLTSHSRPLLEKVAELYGGTVAEWQPQGGGAMAWEVVTTSNRLPIMVPPQPITQWYEYWTGGGCKHRCDGRTNVLTDELCDPEDFAHKEALDRPTTRLNVVLRDVEGIGVWRLETHGINAAMELPDAAEFLARAGGYVNGWISLEPRTSKAEVPDRQNGGTKIQTRHFHVPIIEIDVTPAELMAGKGRVQTPTLEGPVEQKALEAGTTQSTEQPALSLPTDDDIDGATLDGLRAMWKYLNDHDSLEVNGLGDKIMARVQHLQQSDQPDAVEGPVEGEIVDPTPAAQEQGDADVIWQQVLAAAGDRGMSLPDVEADFTTRYSMTSAEASAGELAAYLQVLAGSEAVAS